MQTKKYRTTIRCKGVNMDINYKAYSPKLILERVIESLTSIEKLTRFEIDEKYNNSIVTRLDKRPIKW